MAKNVKSGPYVGATPNPVPFGPGVGTTRIAWDTGDNSSGHVFVSSSGGPRSLFASGTRGFQEASFIHAGTSYEFELCTEGTQPQVLSTVTVSRSEVPWELISDGLVNYVEREEQVSEVAKVLTKILPHFVNNIRYYQYFRFWEQHGFHLTPVHFYQPIPDTRDLSDDLWRKESMLVGVDMNETVQLELLREIFPKFKHEYDRFPREPTSLPHEFYFNNGQFGGTDALALYCMVRHFAPRLIVEVGSGFSTRVTAEAAVRNGDTKLICIEPYANEPVRHEIFKTGFPGLTELIPRKVEDVDIEFFQRLEPGDFLFIDTSHVVKIGGDVNYLFLEVVPRLKPGVIVHVHDIFFPLEYRRDWVMDQLSFYTEQYLLQGFLAFNSEFEVLLCNTYLGHKYLADLQTTFPNSPWWGGGSFWMRRKVE